MYDFLVQYFSTPAENVLIGLVTYFQNFTVCFGFRYLHVMFYGKR